ncbi:MAG: hypothetical protein ACXVDA_05600 [Ktedonobacterales bacterium]
MHGAFTDDTRTTASRRGISRTAAAGAFSVDRAHHAGRLTSPPATFITGAETTTAAAATLSSASAYHMPGVAPSTINGIGSATALPALPFANPDPFGTPYLAPSADPHVWLIALPTSGGGLRSLEGAGRAGAIRVSRPYGHLRSIRPVTLDPFAAGDPAATTTTGSLKPSTATPRSRRARSLASPSGSLGTATATTLPANRPLPQVVSAVEVETDAGIFRVERRDSVLTHSDLAWAMANLEAGEPDSTVPLPRRQLALLLMLLPQPEDPEHPELDPTWGWAHRLRGPWERGPLHPRGRLGRLIAFDPDDTGKGAHRACFELLGTDEVVWAVGVPCFRTGSVYELVPLGKGLTPSRWLTWPLSKGRKRTGSAERPTWEIARIVFRVGAPRWPLAGVVEPLGPMGVAG